ncbi:uncharacterized protein TNCV_505161 [Trichonephila clavipes]|nr:uncharacterized protein TNCV_505161 [Trichonephila clavipes]
MHIHSSGSQDSFCVCDIYPSISPCSVQSKREQRSKHVGCGSPVVKVSDHGRHVMSSNPLPLKTHRIGQRCVLNLLRAETSSRWCGVVVRRGVPAQVSSTSLDHGSK